MSYWREQARPVIQSVLSATAGQPEAAINRALAEAYPFGHSRGPHARNAWREEIHHQRGALPPAPTGQGDLFKEEEPPSLL